MNETVFIYSLKDPITYQIKYIGKTIDINRRYKEHIQTHRNRKSKKNSWIISLIKNGLEPIINPTIVIKYDTIRDSEETENHYYIDVYFPDTEQAIYFELPKTEKNIEIQVVNKLNEFIIIN